MKNVLAPIVAVGVALMAISAVAQDAQGEAVKVKAEKVKMASVKGTLVVKKDAAGMVESIVIQKASEGGAVVEVKLIVEDQAAAVALDGKMVSAKGTMEGEALKVASLSEVKPKAPKAEGQEAKPRKPKAPKAEGGEQGAAPMAE